MGTGNRVQNASNLQVLTVGNGVSIASEVRDGVIFTSETVRDGVNFASDWSEIDRIGPGKQGMPELHDDCPRPLRDRLLSKVSGLSGME
jgi:hypothetical protein